MLKPEQIPDAVAWAAHSVFWDAVYDGKPIDLEIEFDKLFHYAIAAALRAWPGAVFSIENGNAWLPLPTPPKGESDD